MRKDGLVALTSPISLGKPFHGTSTQRNWLVVNSFYFFLQTVDPYLIFNTWLFNCNGVVILTIHLVSLNYFRKEFEILCKSLSCWLFLHLSLFCFVIITSGRKIQVSKLHQTINKSTITISPTQLIAPLSAENLKSLSVLSSSALVSGILTNTRE